MNDNAQDYTEDSAGLGVYTSLAEGMDEALASHYAPERLQPLFDSTLNYISAQMQQGLILPYFAQINADTWQDTDKTVDVYVTDPTEGRAINLEARGKDYATNILSYPSDLPADVLPMMPEIPLGELIVCHEVVVQQAKEQHKTVDQHISHLFVHGLLHLFGFDHELGESEQAEMESFEIAILAQHGLPNPYLADEE
ncbi:rRNA maturation RNase YbeY [Psychrobacter aestuarii]|uniref:Endoribonuclease YbeY n=1 Tax=Psychrobacter aestuarii TaxID=556327 RepID=A0ABN0W0A7_9GAMM|nr:rRNA maturation RNase YbeY [Psychrobacter aestuarii]